MKRTDMAWTDKLPPALENCSPDWENKTSVVLELKQTEQTARVNIKRSSFLASNIWHRRWFVSVDYQDLTLTNMSRWLMMEHTIDLSPNDLRMRIMPYDTFSPFGEKVMHWLSPFSPSTQYELSRCARLAFDKEALLMNEEELETTHSMIISPMIEAIPFGTPIREVLPKLVEADIIASRYLSGGKTRGPRNNSGLLSELSDAEDGMVDGMFIMRRNKKNPATETKWRDWCKAYCIENDAGRDEAFTQIMQWAMERWAPMKKAA